MAIIVGSCGSVSEPEKADTVGARADYDSCHSNTHSRHVLSLPALALALVTWTGWDGVMYDEWEGGWVYSLAQYRWI